MIHLKNQFYIIPGFLHFRQLLFFVMMAQGDFSWQIFQHDRVHLVLWGHKMCSVYQSLKRIIYMVEAMSEFISVKANIKSLSVSRCLSYLGKCCSWLTVTFIDVNFWWIVWIKEGRIIFSIHCTKHPHFSGLWKSIYGQSVLSYSVACYSSVYEI